MAPNSFSLSLAPSPSDYSSALQRDILVHGRLYVSQNYLCFYSNIFGWETCLTIKLKDVVSANDIQMNRIPLTAANLSFRLRCPKRRRRW